MKMDIACPVELIRFEQVDFGEERRQAYLTFLNESTYTITALSGRLSLLDAEGNEVGDPEVSFGPIAARAGESFASHLALDAFDTFETAEMLVEEVRFDGEEPWVLHPSRIRDYDPPLLEEGPARNALIAIAGHDAVCFPEDRDSLWICVCGRFNRWRWTSCRRCRRDRDTVLAQFTRERVGAAYSEHLKEAQHSPPRVIVQGAPKKPKLPPEYADAKAVQGKIRKKKPPAKAKRRKEPRPRRAYAPRRASPLSLEKWVVIGVSIVLVALLIVGFVSLSSRLNRSQQAGEAIEERQMITMDYLDPL